MSLSRKLAPVIVSYVKGTVSPVLAVNCTDAGSTLNNLGINSLESSNANDPLFIVLSENARNDPPVNWS